MKVFFAPMQGYTDATYRQLHKDVFGGIDYYCAPFARVEKGEMRHQDLAHLRACADNVDSLITQVIFNSEDEFRILISAIKILGYKHIDLNMGCPYPMQTNKGRGAAMIHNSQTVKSICNIINADNEINYSVKMRLGLDDADAWRRIIPILNDCNLTHITLHPRTAMQMYSGDLHKDQLDDFIRICEKPVVYNGDLQSISDINSIIAQYPDIHGIMIGRGLLARPTLAMEWRQGEMPQEQRLSTLLHFHHKLLQQYQSTLCGETQILQKMRTFWEYLEPEIGHKSHKAIRKATTMARYLAAVNGICLRER